MPKPTSDDVDHLNNPSINELQNSRKDSHNEWNFVPLEEVKKNMGSTKYPSEKIHYVKGMVEDIVPKTMPKKISLLRLDTDFYESTKHELENFYPLLQPGGVLIIDDYGHFKGAKKAVDDYFDQMPSKPFLNRIDYTGRLVIKPIHLNS